MNILGEPFCSNTVVCLLVLKDSCPLYSKLHSPHANIYASLSSLQHQLMSKILSKHAQLKVLMSHHLTLVWVKFGIIHPGAKFLSIYGCTKLENWNWGKIHHTIVGNMLNNSCRYSHSKRERLEKRKESQTSIHLKIQLGRLQCRNNFFKFIYLFWERERDQRQRQRERNSQAGSVLTAQMWGSIPWTMRSWPEPKSGIGHSTNWATQAPQKTTVKFLKWEFASMQCNNAYN